MMKRDDFSCLHLGSIVLKIWLIIVKTNYLMANFKMTCIKFFTNRTRTLILPINYSIACADLWVFKSSQMAKRITPICLRSQDSKFLRKATTWSWILTKAKWISNDKLVKVGLIFLLEFFSISTLQHVCNQSRFVNQVSLNFTVRETIEKKGEGYLKKFELAKKQFFSNSF